MGYWQQDEEGHSFAVLSDMLWGDPPADIMDDAIDKIVKTFRRDVGRKPTKAELEAGLKFSLGTYKEA